jgi:flavodoxin
MKKVLVAYVSLTGRTQMMAEHIAEGVRFAGLQATVKKTSDLTTPEDLAGYDGYIFGSPTYHRDMAGPMKNFLFQAKSADLKGKLGGAFGSYTQRRRSGHDLRDDGVRLWDGTLQPGLLQSDRGLGGHHRGHA